MDPIINPALFYWMSVAESIGIYAFILALISGITLVIVCGVYAFDSPWDEDEEKNFKKAIKILAIVLMLSILFSIFIPSKNTMIEMLIAKYATYDNANWTLETVKSAVDYIVEAIKSLK